MTEGKNIQPYLRQNNRRVNNKLKITNIAVKRDYVEISIEHWGFKWIEELSITYSDDVSFEFGYRNFEAFNKEFRDKWESKLWIFELVIPRQFFEKYNLDQFHYHRVDKYNTDILFKVKQ